MDESRDSGPGGRRGTGPDRSRGTGPDRSRDTEPDGSRDTEPDGSLRSQGGYMTLEAAMVFPAVFALVIMLLYLTFFLYDKCRMTQDLYTAAYRQSIARNAKAAVPEVDTSGYFMLRSCEAEVSGGSVVRASASGSMAPALLTGTGEEGTGGSGTWEIRVTMEARKTDPPQSFRRYRRIAAIARQALSGGETGDG